MTAQQPQITSKSILQLAAPIMLTNTLQISFSMIDALWLARVGTTELAAVSLVSPVMMLLISMGIGTSIAGTIMVAHAVGSGNGKKESSIAGQTVLVVTSIAVLIALVGFFFSPSIVKSMGPEPELIPLATTYLKFMLLTTPLKFGFSLYASLLYGRGDTITPLKLLLLSVIAHLALSPFLITGAGIFAPLGVHGAIITNFCSRGGVAAIAFVMLFRGSRGLQVRLSDLKPQPSIIRQLLRLGIPSGLEQSTRHLGMIVMMTLVANFGTATIAAYGLGNKIFHFLVMPSVALGQGLTAMVGQRIGAELYMESRQLTYRTIRNIFIVYSVVGVILSVVALPLFSTLVVDLDVAEQGGGFFKIVGLCIPFAAALTATNGALRGARRTMAAFMVTAVAFWGIQLPLAGLLSLNLGFNEAGLWWSIFTANTAGAVMAAFFFYLKVKQSSWAGQGNIKKPA